MTNKILSYIIFIIALVTAGVFIYPYLGTHQEVKEGNIKKAQLPKPVFISKEKTEEKNTSSLKKVDLKHDQNKSVKKKKKKDGSDVIIAKKYLKDEENISKDDLNVSEENQILSRKNGDRQNRQIDPEKIMGVDPIPVKLHTPDKNYTDINIQKAPSINKPLTQYLDEVNAELGNPVLIRIFKSTYLLEIWIKGDGEYKHLKSYPICKYSGELGPKLKEGDKQAPEGFYKITKDSLNPNSRFHLSMNIGYPNRYDKEHNRTGSYIMIHGGCVSIGCFAMGDDQIEEIYELVESALNAGQKEVQVQIYPFRMTKKELKRHSKNKWYQFWLNLKEGYDYFEEKRLPPKVDVKDGNYTFK